MINLEGGYYDDVSVSTTLNPTGKIAYVHHVHSASVDGGTTETNDSSAKASVTYMAETNKTKGGCYTKSNQKTCDGIVTINVRGMTNHGEDEWGFCDKCGRHSGSEAANIPWGGSYRCGAKIGSGYSVSCGYENGDLISATITY